MYTPETVNEAVENHIRAKYGAKRGSLKAAANGFDVSQAFLSQVLGSSKMPPKRMLEEMGLKRVVLYVPKEQP